MLVKKYIKGKLSLVDVVNYLEPFLIYTIDLTFMQYKEINSFIYQKIKEYNIQYNEYEKAFSVLKYQKPIMYTPFDDGTYAFLSLCTNMFIIFYSNKPCMTIRFG